MGNKGWAQRLWRNIIDNLSHTAIAGNLFDPVDAFHVMGFLFAPFIKSQQRRVFERKHRETGHERIA